MKFLNLTVSFVILFLLAALSTSPAASLVPTNSTWRYFKGTEEASSPVSAWRGVGFNDASWLTGQAPFFYENSSGYSGNTTLSDMNGGYSCIFMRRTFTVADPADIAQLLITLRSDDGCIVWINGTEVPPRVNMPGGDIPFSGTSNGASGEPNEVFESPINNPQSLLVAGENVLAVQAFNASLTGSSDFLIEASLDSVDVDPIPPTIANIDPAPGTHAILTQITVTFSETVEGVDAFDLLIDGTPASTVVGGGDTYTFIFNQPPFGTVDVEWASNHGIVDQAVPPNDFDESAPGASWQYTLMDILAPSVVVTTPTINTTVRSLDTIHITFSEDVTGVNASDLRINGNAATGLQTLSSSQYTFTFPQPPTGAVAVAWTTGHGIADLAATPNDFEGGSWSYTLDPNAVQGALYITEFMAANDGFLGTPDPDADDPSLAPTIYPDWIEIHNSGDLTAELEGWFLTDDADDLQKWEFPRTNLLAKGYMIVFASGENRRTPGAPLHANFNLSRDGEFLALVRPDGVTIASAYSPEYPAQIDNVSYGLPTVSAPTTVVSDTSEVRVHIPTDGSLDAEWAQLGFDDSSWTSGFNGVGYEGNTVITPNLSSAIQTDVDAQMRSVSASAYIRIPFNVPDASAVSQLTLRMQYDDGFSAYLNGGEVARANVPNVMMGGTNVFVQWEDTASTSRADADALAPEEFDVSFGLQGIVAGENILAIHGLNFSASADDFLIAAELDARTADIQPDAPRYFTSPTPGAANGTGVDDLGPILTDLDNEPEVPQEGEDMVVTVRVTPTFSETINSVLLRYRVMYNAESSVAMNDAGTGADETAGDGIYTAVIPGGLAVPGQMVRWYVTAQDGLGRTTREPAFLDPVDSAEYDGTIVFLEQTNNLPILHWFAQNPAGANNDNGVQSSFFYKGRFYDNCNINIHGQSSRGFPKRSYDIDFHGNEFVWDEDEIAVDDINLLQTYSDKAKMRNVIPYEMIADAGAAHHFVVPVRVHQNGTFFATYDLVENGDDRYLSRLGKDPNGALYKMYTTFTSSTHANIGINVNAEKKTRREEGSEDLHELFDNFVSAAQPDAAARRRYMYDNVNIPATVNFLASMAATSSHDCCHKNYYVYRDSDGTGEWEGMIWDVDLSFGRRWNSAETYWDNNMHTDTSAFVGGNNGFFREIFNTPATRQMHLRRLRTIMDELYQSNDVSLSDRRLESRIDELANDLRADSQMDLERWGTWIDGSVGPIFDQNHVDYETLAEAVERLKQHLVDRREYVFGGSGSFSELPDAQPDNATLAFGVIEYNPASGNQEQEYIELVNTNNFAMDISGWRLEGAVSMTFQGGVVIPAGTSLFASPNVRAFRARTTSPRSGEERFVQGAYRGQLSARGEEIYFIDHKGRTNRTIVYPGNPSLPQQHLRITEIMYHPAPAPDGSLFDTEDFEYVELKNIGGVSVPLIGVKFVNGIQFNFSDSAVTSLAPGQTVVVVRNQAAFVSRYGAGVTVAGEYTLFLDNGGERIQLLDDDNEEILDFSYDDDWYPSTDGLGFSLVIVDENNAIFSTWDEKESWRPSGVFQGSPGASDPTPDTVAPILVNEVLTHTDLPQVDTIELYNPTTNDVNIGGWFLSDDFFAPRKFRIPDNTTILAGGYLTFDEADFNPTPEVPPSFSLSSQGDDVFVFSGDGTDLTGYFHGDDFGAVENGVTFGRYITSTGADHFVRQAFNTLGLTNSLPRVGPVVISEIHYHPVDLPGGVDNDAEEFVELRNISGSPVNLFNPANPSDTWELRDAVDFVFPANVTMPANSYLLVVGFNPAHAPSLNAFRTRFGLSDSVPIYGPWDGKLDNSAEDVELFRPDTPEEVGETPYIRVDKVDYEDDLPWTSAADGIGPSLQRLVDSEYGNDPINWFGAAPSPGGEVSGGVAPTITGQSGDQVVVMGNDVVLSVTAQGDSLNYQWRFQGSVLVGETGGTLSLSEVQFEQAGIYDVVVFNGSGSDVSDPIDVQVLIPASITSQPRSLTVEYTELAVFTVSAISESAISYQWRKDGVPIPGATGTTLQIVNAQASDRGTYDVLITDAIGTIASEPAVLQVLVPPILVYPQGNLDLRVVEGQDLVVGVEIREDVTLPLSYRWRLGFSSVTEDRNAFQTFFYVTNLTQNAVPQFNRISVTVTNIADRVGVTLIHPLIFLADTDGDFMPDEYENAHANLDPNNAADAGLDTDLDSMTNYEEYLADTDPNDDQSYLKVEAVEVGPGVEVIFEATPHRTYTVLYKDDLNQAQWTKLRDVVGDTAGRTVRVADPDGSMQRFYRLATPQIADEERFELP